MEKPKFHKPHIYIFNSSGCHGHYLTYLIDRLSKVTPKIEQLPFNNLGNSHNKIDYSGFSKFVDWEDHEQNKNLKDANIVKIIWSNDIVYYERVSLNRVSAIAGLKRRAYQTPNEYAAMLADALGDAAPSARRIAREYAALRYTGGSTAAADSASGADTDDDNSVEQAWRSVRGALIGRAFRRLLPGGNQE